MSGQGQNAGTNDEGVPMTKSGQPDKRTQAGREAAGVSSSNDGDATGQGRAGAGGVSDDGVPLKKDGSEDKRFKGTS